MKNEMVKQVLRSFVPLLAAMVAVVGTASAQSTWNQNTACPGWNNPINFTAGSSTLYNYQGVIGTKPAQAPDVMNGITGMNFSGSAIINASGLANASPNATSGDPATLPGNSIDKAFYINDTNTQCTGHPRNRDPNAGDILPYVPTQFNTIDTTGMTVPTQLSRSIRIGDGRGQGKAVALYYNMYVTPENAMLFLYYACVFENPGHGTSQDPAFIVRVMKQNGAGNWVQASPTYDNQTHCDTLAYMVPSTPASNGGTVVIGQNGWHNSTMTYNCNWKEWAKVSMNLSAFLFSTVRIEVMVCDCSMTQHFSYAYICGECRPMSITSSGCPAGMSTDVTTLSAPRGLDNYRWYASQHGVSSSTQYFYQPTTLPTSTAYFRWRPLTDSIGTEADTAYIYHVKAADFIIHYRPNEAHNPNIPVTDSVSNWQSFRCEMTSAIDPAKPFKSSLYVNVQNTKPTMDIDSLSICGGDVRLYNKSFVPGDPNKVNKAATQWSFYSNPSCLGLADTVLVGDTAWMHFNTGAIQGVRVRTNNFQNPNEELCYSEAVYPIRPLPNPVGGITITPSSRVLCASDPVADLYDTCASSTYRVWRFRSADNDSTHAVGDSIVGSSADENRSLHHTFPITHTDGFEPIELTIRNGLFYLNPENQSQVIWCENTLYDSISVFTNPDLTVVGDSIVCAGTVTDITVSSDIPNCTYQWSTTRGTVTGGLPAGPHLAVYPYADTATYHVLVTSPAPQNCEAWDSAHAFRVVPQLKMFPEDGRVCPDDPVTLIGSRAHHFTWTASPADTSLVGQDSLPTVVVTPQVTTTYTLVGHGSNDCDATPLTTTVTVYPYPIPRVELDPGIVDSEAPTITLKDVSPYSVSSAWTFDGAETETGSVVTHTFEEANGVDSVYVTLTTANELGCATVYPFGIPVNMYTAWFPNIFTPGSEDENAIFRLYTINAYENFHIYIYNRRGELVFDSEDPAFEWDGTYNGSPCPQGTYVFICRFRKPGTYNLASQYGSVTLVR